MKRRTLFVTSLAAATVSTARAQTPKRVGVLMPFAQDDPATVGHLELFRKTLQEAGWSEGPNLAVEYRWAAGDVGRLTDLAKELVAAGCDVVLVRATPTALAMARVTKTVPVVFVVVSDPVGEGLAASLARPGGNLTGFTNAEASLAGKWLQHLREAAPGIQRVFYPDDPDGAAGGGKFYLNLLQTAAASIGVKVEPAIIRAESDIARVIAAFASEPNGGLVVAPGVRTTQWRKRFIAEAATHRLPAIYAFPSIAAEGGLMSYGVEVADLYRRAAGYVDRILRGTRPLDLPVQAPEKFSLSINLRTARTLGLTLSPFLLTQADEVIE